MGDKTLRNLYDEQLREHYAALKQAMPAVTGMAREAHAPFLGEVLIEANRGIARGIDRIGDLFERHRMDPSSVRSAAMAGLADEARRQAIEADFADPETKDAALIGQYQRMAHLAIAGFGTLRSFALRLGLSEDAATLQSCLDTLWDSDRRLTDLAETRINRAAAERA